MTVAEKLVTAKELLCMPHDGFRYELVRGRLSKMAPAGNVHGRTAINFSTPLALHVRENDLGVVFAAETGFRLSENPDTVRAPDVAFVRRERVEAAGDVEGYWPGAPDLVVEVVSPNDAYAEVEEKVVCWLDAGSRMVVVVNPRSRTVAVRRSRTDVEILTEEDTLGGGDVVPGWNLPVAEIFR